MKSLTLHNIEPDLAQKIEEIARASHTSLNRAIQTLLRQSLGLETGGHNRRADFEEFLNVWNDREYRSFTEAQADFERVDPNDWK